MPENQTISKGAQRALIGAGIEAAGASVFLLAKQAARQHEPA